MAAAVIPIVAAAAPLIIPLIKSAVLHVEALFGHKTGPTKFEVVLAYVAKLAEALSTAGKIPGTLDASSIAALIESIVQQMKADGILTPEVAGPLVTSANASLTMGTTLHIMGGTLQLG